MWRSYFFLFLFLISRTSCLSYCLLLILLSHFIHPIVLTSYFLLPTSDCYSLAPYLLLLTSFSLFCYVLVVLVLASYPLLLIVLTACFLLVWVLTSDFVFLWLLNVIPSSCSYFSLLLRLAFLTAYALLFASDSLRFLFRASCCSYVLLLTVLSHDFLLFTFLISCSLFFLLLIVLTSYFSYVLILLTSFSARRTSYASCCLRLTDPTSYFLPLLLLTS